jgi:SAM-dependent methyltransferase
MTNKENYFRHRNSEIKTHNGRDKLAEREVKTLLTVLDINDSDSALNGKTVIDLGCGDQFLKNSFRIRAAKYTGIDIDECNLEFDEVPVGDECCDIAVSMAVIEHLTEPGHFLNEVKRILKPGGVLWMDTPDIQACKAKFWNDPTHVHPYTRTSFQILMEMNGFTDVLITPNYRCKPKKFYHNSNFNFFRARYLMPFSGTNSLPIPGFIKGHCTGLFALGRKPL